MLLSVLQSWLLLGPAGCVQYGAYIEQLASEMGVPFSFRRRGGAGADAGGAAGGHPAHGLGGHHRVHQL